MNRLISTLSLGLTIATLCLSAHAQSETAAPKQQNKMVTCNKEAKVTGKKGDERRAFMSQCLSGSAKQGSADTVKDASADRTKACKAEAKGMKGAARKDAISQCMAKAA